MPDNIFLSLFLNIGLLVLVATILTKIPAVRRLLLNEQNSYRNRFCLAVIFGLVSILSTYTGVSVNGAIVNTRVIGVIAAGLLGGPSVGIGTSIIAGTHRYLFDIGGFTALSCALSTFVEGLLGATFSKYFQRGKLDSVSIFSLTVVAEICQMLIILLIAKPFADALALVKIIALPMILLNAFGMVVFIATFNMVFLEEDNKSAANIKLAFQVVEQCLPHLKHGLRSQKDMEAAADIIFQALPCSGVMITNTTQILAFKTTAQEQHQLQMSQIPTTALESMKHLDVVTQPMDFLSKNHMMIAAPLTEKEEAVGSLVLITKKQWRSSNANVGFITDLAKLFSTQHELADLEYQKRLRKKAEFKALQSQVNPHFLYNALNTIASVCRENPMRARELLLTLGTYYRQTLENERFMINLHTELYHVKNYLELEKARFEENLQVDIDIPKELHGMVPAFILQPLVENAIQHGADSTGKRYVKIAATPESDGICLKIMDHGTGIRPEVMEHLYSNGNTEHCFGLSNVHKRLKSIFGEEYGLEIHSSPNGSAISCLIPQNHAAGFDTEEERSSQL